MEDKKLFVSKLFEALKLSSMCRSLVSLEYFDRLERKDIAEEYPELDGYYGTGEYVVATFKDGYKKYICVNADSCWGILHDVDRHLF